jgi:RNA ligase
MSKLSYSKILPYIEEGYISTQFHPENTDVCIFNYTPKCQFEQKWDDVTMKCRGLIMNIKTGEHLSNPFPKFFNYDEHIQRGFAIPNEIPVVTEKYDGSLGILYWLNDKPYIATRGSFTSDQAIWATDWIRNQTQQDLNELSKEYTYLFEIIYPDNKIVVDYDFEGLVWIGLEPLSDNPSQPAITFFKFAERVPFSNVRELKEGNEENREGYVLHYTQSNVRVKIKFDEYVRLHKIVTGLSEKGIWELMKDSGIDLDAKDIIENVPDEFFEWMTSVIEDIRSNYEEIEDSARYTYEVVKHMESRKEIAEIVKRSEYPSVVFSMIDNKNYKPLIFELVKPSRNKIKI